MESSEKGIGKEVEEKEEKGEEENEVRKDLVERVERKDRKFLYGEDERRREEKEGQKKNRRPRARQVLGKSGRATPFAFGCRIGYVSTLQLKGCREGRR